MFQKWKNRLWFRSSLSRASVGPWVKPRLNLGRALVKYLSFCTTFFTSHVLNWIQKYLWKTIICTFFLILVHCEATYWQKKLQVSKKKKQAPINKSNLWTNTNGPYGNEKVNHVKKSTDKKADSYIDVSWYTVVLLLLDQTYYSIVLYLFKKVFFSIPM